MTGVGVGHAEGYVRTHYGTGGHDLASDNEVSRSGRSERHGEDKQQQKRHSQRCQRLGAESGISPDSNARHGSENGPAGGCQQWYGGPSTQDPCGLRVSCKAHRKGPEMNSTAPLRPDFPNLRPM